MYFTSRGAFVNEIMDKFSFSQVGILLCDFRTEASELSE